MNLHGIASSYVATVNPWVSGQYRQSTGYTTNADGSRSPSYASAVSVQIQMQALTFKDLTQLSGVNLNGEARAMYINGLIEGVDRPSQRGGDIITLADGSIWLVAHVLENWNATAGWTKVAVTRQVS